MTVTPLGPRLLIEIEPEAGTFQGSSLIKPDTVHESAVGWGKVLAIGSGTPTKAGLVPVEGIKVGNKVAFIKFLREAHTNKALASTLGDDLLIIELKDVVLIDDGSF